MDQYFNSYDTLDTYQVLLATYGFSLQIYFDFSAYADMAVALGLALGFRFPYNFNSPYSASSLVDFWRRWHITLSNWLRDYIYIPLGGNRTGKNKQYLNIIITMCLGGLWHGASWTFVLWGLAHGILIGTVHFYRTIFVKNKDEKKQISKTLNFF